MVAILAIGLVMSMVSDVFLTERNMYNVTRNFAFFGIIALGMTAVIVTAGIDLSVGSLMGLTGIAAALAMNAGYSVGAGFAACMGTAVLVGLVNGGAHRVPPDAALRGHPRDARHGPLDRHGHLEQQDVLRVRPGPGPVRVDRGGEHVRRPEPGLGPHRADPGLHLRLPLHHLGALGLRGRRQRGGGQALGHSGRAGDRLGLRRLVELRGARRLPDGRVVRVGHQRARAHLRAQRDRGLGDRRREPHGRDRLRDRGSDRGRPHGAHPQLAAPSPASTPSGSSSSSASSSSSRSSWSGCGTGAPDGAPDPLRAAAGRRPATHHTTTTPTTGEAPCGSSSSQRPPPPRSPSRAERPSRTATPS